MSQISSVPGAASWVWACEDLLFTGFSYFHVQSLFADTFRVREMWRVAPNRVGVFLNDKGTQIEYYTVDGIHSAGFTRCWITHCVLW
jgi:hypothetical protein